MTIYSITCISRVKNQNGNISKGIRGKKTIINRAQECINIF